MPANYVMSLVDKGKGTKAELEKKWEDAKAIAAKSGHKDDYAYIIGIFKKMVGEQTNESKSQFSLVKRVLGERGKTKKKKPMAEDETDG